MTAISYKCESLDAVGSDFEDDVLWDVTSCSLIDCYHRFRSPSLA
jgi:hypothetical protein